MTMNNTFKELFSPIQAEETLKGSHEKVSCREDAGIHHSEDGKAKISLLRCGMRMFSGMLFGGHRL